MNSKALLCVEGLTVSFATDEGRVAVVEDVEFLLREGETLGLVGESGSGKSVTAQAIMRLLPSPPSRIEKGKIDFEGEDLAQLEPRSMQKIRGDRLAMVFQEPMTSLNPTIPLGYQIAEPLILHRGMHYVEAKEFVIRMLKQVGIGNAERRLDQYPHELSGGLRQRMMIAMAIICNPKLLIADEPTTALDVTIQAQIMDLLQSLQKELGLAILLITHDLGMVAEMCRNVAVMYAGRIVERGTSAEVLRRPRHPYTAGLLNSSPRRARKGERLPTIPGLVPPPGRRGAGCSFAARCSRATDRCSAELPVLAESARAAACWNPLP
jgi:oligopeptide/dipeptide ABC transporter ATP-binding protein